jgi:hypothetical protein
MDDLFLEPCALGSRHGTQRAALMSENLSVRRRILGRVPAKPLSAADFPAVGPAAGAAAQAPQPAAKSSGWARIAAGQPQQEPQEPQQQQSQQQESQQQQEQAEVPQVVSQAEALLQRPEPEAAQHVAQVPWESASDWAPTGGAADGQASADDDDADFSDLLSNLRVSAPSVPGVHPPFPSAGSATSGWGRTRHDKASFLNSGS